MLQVATAVVVQLFVHPQNMGKRLDSPVLVSVREVFCTEFLVKWGMRIRGDHSMFGFWELGGGMMVLVVINFITQLIDNSFTTSNVVSAIPTVKCFPFHSPKNLTNS